MKNICYDVSKGVHFELCIVFFFKKALFTGIEVVCDSATSTPITHNYSRSKSSMRNGPLGPAGPPIPITIVAHRIFT
jgi:hypothetical protein